MGLVLTRKLNDSVIVADNLVITLVQIKGKQARLHFSDLNEIDGKKTKIDRYEEWLEKAREWQKKTT